MWTKRIGVKANGPTDPLLQTESTLSKREQIFALAGNKIPSYTPFSLKPKIKKRLVSGHAFSSLRVLYDSFCENGEKEQKHGESKVETIVMVGIAPWGGTV